VIAMHLTSPEQVLASTRSALGLPTAKDGNAVDDTLLAQLLRAVAWSSCPCQPFILVREVERTLSGLVDDVDSLHERILQSLETLLATGDLLEPGLVTHAIELPKGALFTAPLSFAMLSTDVALIFGIASTDVFEGQPELLGRIVYDGASRRIHARPSEPLGAKLRHAGLRELTMQAWLKEPATEAASVFLDEAKATLKRADPADSAIDGLEVFDSSRGGIYSTCWGAPGDRSGLFIARRPKAYGNTHWMLVELSAGRVEQTAHLPRIGSSLRGCDEAWRLQLALNAMNGRPQRYRVRKENAIAYLDMLFPVPLWAHRHLLVLGRQAQRQQSICSYQVPESLLGEARSFLEQRLWLKTTS
jgi:hypothetical protein